MVTARDKSKYGGSTPQFSHIPAVLISASCALFCAWDAQRGVAAAVARHHFDLFTDNVFNGFEDFPGSSLPEERGHSHFCRKEKRGSKEFQVVALSGGCVFLEARRWPGFHLFGPLHQYGCRFQLPPLTITYTMIMTIMQPSKACNLAILTSRCSQTLTPTNGVRNSQEPGCARIPGPAHARATPTKRA